MSGRSWWFKSARDVSEDGHEDKEKNGALLTLLLNMSIHSL